MTELWLGRRFTRNERGNFEAWAKVGVDRVCLEVDGHFVAPEDREPETILLKLHHRLQKAAREKWAVREATSVQHSFSGGLDHYRVTLTEADLRNLP